MTSLELAKLCAQAYEPDGIPGSQKFGAMGPQAYVVDGKDSDHKVVVFVGTRDPAGWVLNGLAYRIKDTTVPTLNGHVHFGFLEAWKAVRFDVLKAVGMKKVILTGHSQGGAMATLAAPELGSGVRKVVTFGAPRVGDHEFRDFYRKQVARTTRHVWQLDPVALVPGYFSGYRHVCDPKWFDGWGWNLGYSPWAVLKILWNLAGRWQTMLTKLISHHAIENYVVALGRKADGT